MKMDDGYIVMTPASDAINEIIQCTIVLDDGLAASVGHAFSVVVRANSAPIFISRLEN
jgi:hypothetical protein